MPKLNKYAPLAAARKNNPYKLTPEEWEKHLKLQDERTIRKLYSKMHNRGGPEWDRIKDLFVKVLIEKQNKLIATANDIEPNC